MSRVGRFWVVLGISISLAGCGLKKAESTAPAGADNVFQQHSITKFGIEGKREIALTFDDGPGAGTESILETLEYYQIHATFFVLGSSVTPARKKFLTRMEVDGDVIGNHTYHHNLLTKGYYTNHPSRLIGEMMENHRIIAPYLNLQKHWYFRAPYGGWNARVANIANSDSTLVNYIGPIYWTIGGEDISGPNGQLEDAADWECWAKHLSIARCLQGYLNETDHYKGGVVLMHDIHSNTAVMLKQYIPALLKKGYRFVTLDEIPGLDANLQMARHN